MDDIIDILERLIATAKQGHVKRDLQLAITTISTYRKLEKEDFKKSKLLESRITELEEALKKIVNMEIGECEDIKYVQAHHYHKFREIAKEALEKK